MTSATKREWILSSVMGFFAIAALLTWVRVGPLTIEWQTAAHLAAALAVLGLYDVWLPRGDAADMTGAVAFAAGVLLAGPLAVGAVIAARIISGLVRRDREPILRLLTDVSRRVLALSTAALLLATIGGWSIRVVQPEPVAYARLLAAAVTFFAVDFVLAQVLAGARLRSPVPALMRGMARLLGWMLAAHMSVAVLTVILYGAMGLWGLLISVALLLVMRQSFSLLIKTKETYRATVEALARAIEAQDPSRLGHAERVASLTGAAARALGVHGRDLENLMYAALFHDVGHLGQDDPVGDAGAPTGSADVLANVACLADALAILRILDSWGRVETSQREQDIVAAYLIARMSAFDDARMGMPSAGAGARWTTIGSRLYADTRRDVDRVVERVQMRSERSPVVALPSLPGEI